MGDLAGELNCLQDAINNINMNIKILAKAIIWLASNNSKEEKQKGLSLIEELFDVHLISKK